jgi:hypothetical protein
MRQILRARAIRGYVATAFLCWLPLQMCWAQGQKVKSNEVKPEKLVVRVVDGFTGLPMWFEFPNVWVSSAEESSCFT